MMKGKTETVECLRLATKELIAIRARDGAPQAISWSNGNNPIQISLCAEEWWDELTERCIDALKSEEVDI